MGESRRAEREREREGLRHGGAPLVLARVLAVVGEGEGALSWGLRLRRGWGWRGAGAVGRFRIGGFRIERGGAGDPAVRPGFAIAFADQAPDPGLGLGLPFPPPRGLTGGMITVVISPPSTPLIVGVGEWFSRRSRACRSRRTSGGSWYPPSLGVLLMSEERLLSAKGLRRASTVRRLERGEW